MVRLSTAEGLYWWGSVRARAGDLGLFCGADRRTRLKVVLDVTQEFTWWADNAHTARSRNIWTFTKALLL